jgi:hypothetical protein
MTPGDDNRLPVNEIILKGTDPPLNSAIKVPYSTSHPSKCPDPVRKRTVHRVGKNPGFFKKNPAQWVFLGFFGFFWVFWVFWVFLGFFCPDERVLGFFFQFHKYF